jgi:DNA-binding NarL/FixJ family response regulator
MLNMRDSATTTVARWATMKGPYDRTMMQSTDRPQPSVLVVENTEIWQNQLQAAAREAGFETETWGVVSSQSQLKQRLLECGTRGVAPPELVLVDLHVEDSPDEYERTSIPFDRPLDQLGDDEGAYMVTVVRVAFDSAPDFDSIPRVIVCTRLYDVLLAMDAFRRGAAEYVVKDHEQRASDLAKVFKAVHNAGDDYDSTTRYRALHDYGFEGALGERDARILAMLAAGLKNGEIAKDLFVAEKTVVNAKAAYAQLMEVPTGAAPAKFVTHLRQPVILPAARRRRRRRTSG